MTTPFDYLDAQRRVAKARAFKMPGSVAGNVSPTPGAEAPFQGPKMPPKAPKASMWDKINQPSKMPSAPSFKGMGKAGMRFGFPAALAGMVYSDRDKPADERYFPNTGAVLDGASEDVANAEGIGAKGSAANRSIFPAMMGLAHDTYNNAKAFVTGTPEGYTPPDMEPNIEATFTPAELAARKLQAQQGQTQAQTQSTPGSSMSQFDAALLAQMGGQQGQAPAAPAVDAGPQMVVPKGNNSYFINHGAGTSQFPTVQGGQDFEGEGGKAEGKKQFFNQMERAFEPQAAVPQNLPQALPQVAGQAPTSPMVAALNENPAPRIPKNASYGDLMQYRMDNLNYRADLLPARARAKSQATQRERDVADRNFGFGQLKFGTYANVKGLELGQDQQRIDNNQMNNRTNQLLRLRGQNQTGDIARLKAGGAADKPVTDGDWIKNQNDARQRAEMMFADAPDGFADVATQYTQYGVTMKTIFDIYQQITGAQSAVGRPDASKLGLAELDVAMRTALGIN